MVKWFIYLMLLYWKEIVAQSDNVDLVVLSSSLNLSSGAGEYLVCVGRSETGVNITWSLNNRVLSSDRVNESNIIEGNNIFKASFLSLCNVRVNDSGIYSCNVSNGRSFAEGSIMVHVSSSENTDLVVLSRSLNLSRGAGEYLVCVGRSETGVNITWSLNNRVLSSDRVNESNIVEGDNNFKVSFLSLCNVRVNDSGIYSCNVSNRRNFTEGSIMVHVSSDELLNTAEIETSTNTTDTTMVTITKQTGPTENDFIGGIAGGIVGGIVGAIILIAILLAMVIIIFHTKNGCEKPVKYHDTVYEEVSASKNSLSSSKNTNFKTSSQTNNFQDGTKKNSEKCGTRKSDTIELTYADLPTELSNMTMSFNEAYTDTSFDNDNIYYT